MEPIVILSDAHRRHLETKLEMARFTIAAYESSYIAHMPNWHRMYREARATVERLEPILEHLHN